MKRVLIVSGAAILTAFAFCLYFLSPDPKVKAQVTAMAAPSPVEPKARTTILVVHPPTLAASPPTGLHRQPLTDDRKRLFDATDLLRAIQKVAATGTPDERDWALNLIALCSRRFMKPTASASGAAASSESRAMGTAQEEQMKRASLQIDERCKGFRALPPEDKANLKESLSSTGASDFTVLRQLVTIENIEDGRWNDAQAQLITTSLYSGDPIVAREAFWSLLKVIDRYAPGGQERQDAAMEALSPLFLNFPLSDLEQLEACSTKGWCDTWNLPGNETPPSESMQLLMKKYREAISSHADARTIAAIR